MDRNKQVHPMLGSLEFGSGEKTFYEDQGETYFERSVREYTAALLSNGVTYESREVLVGEAIKTALEVDRQLKLLEEVKKNNGKKTY